ncbi:MAG: hydroxymethylpyrimidine/phosphomethylpyrimidine kinase [Deltaproteobacteria bacterium]|nr:hydroxymethylpyrimidine/phosphomethylpyrimidine kinase [Deltaproteobacteria bacterium]MDQ3299301.1 hydroxymethylpyrimidine/phosphomethylpyrimidine kinase [Myxococcota bacterium]
MSIFREPPPNTRPHVLVCSGLDPSGGAGFIADLRVVDAVGARPVGVVTALTVQTTQGVRAMQALDPDFIGTQLAALLGDVEVHAVKLGLLGSTEMARHISYGLDLTAAPVVWDPIATPSRGNVDFDGAAFDEMLQQLARHLTLITPNAFELGLLEHRHIDTLDSAIDAAENLAARLDVAVLVKGGHVPHETAVDVLVHADGTERLEGPRLPRGEDVHGTGCALSAAIAAHLARGVELVEACRRAKAFVAERIGSAISPGRGLPAIV